MKNQNEWRRYVRSGGKPSDIPSYPEGVYKKSWKGYGDWLGIGIVASFDKQFRSFAQAREFVHASKLESWEKWSEYRRSGNKPSDIPSDPAKTYTKDWIG